MAVVVHLCLLFAKTIHNSFNFIVIKLCLGEPCWTFKCKAML